LLIAAFVAVFFMSRAQARPDYCTARSEAVNNLLEQYGERPVAMGLSLSGSIVEVLATPDGTNFTIIITAPNGVTCFVDAGTGWESLPVVKQGTGL
jgi:hypothetical protein